MNTEHLNGLPALLCLAALGHFPAPALAALGQELLAPSSGSLSVPWCETTAPGQRAEAGLCRVHESSLETGTVIKEYVRPDGLVFAVSWRGPVAPDLALLLGAYFSVFQIARHETLAGEQRGSPLSLAKDGLVVQAGGRSPHLFGYAYVTHLVPTGVRIKEVVQ